MQFNICWTADKADRYVRRKTENETNKICELKCDKLFQVVFWPVTEDIKKEHGNKIAY